MKNILGNKLFNKGSLFLVLLIVLCSTLLIIGCPDLFDPPGLKSADTGYFILSVTGSQTQSRTIMPGTPDNEFALYQLIFSKEGQPNIIVDRTHDKLTDPIELKSDTYTLTVYAYTSVANKNDNKPAAFVEPLDLEILLGKAVYKEIELEPYGVGTDQGGKGIFSWDIDFPAGLTELKMEVTPISPTTGGGTYYFAGGLPLQNKIGNAELNAGYYHVVFTLNMANMRTVTWLETLHVYQNMTSLYEYKFKLDHFVRNFYTVTFDVNNGSLSGPSPSGSYFYDELKTNPGTPTRTGYSFTGWFKDGAGSAYTFTENLTGSLTLVAGWNAISYNITYHPNGGTNHPSNTITSYTIESSDITLYPPTRTGYTFDGWFTNIGLTGSALTEIEQGSTGILNLYAKWTPISYSITYHLGDGNNHANNPPNYTIEDLPVTLYAPTRAEHIFKGWFDNSGFTGSAITTIGIGSSGNKVFYAEWEEEEDNQDEDGTAEKPFTVYNLITLQKVGSGEGGWGLDKHYLQTQIINATGFTTPIGNSNPFTGMYNGDGHTITGLTVSLFNTIEGTVRNLGVSGNIAGAANVGAIAGTNNGTIEQCYFFKGSVNGSNSVGGIAGVNNGTVNNCYNDIGVITGSGNNVGGIVGHNNGGTVIHCYSTGNVSGADNVGGIVGQNSNSGSVSMCASLAPQLNVGQQGNQSIGRVIGINYTSSMANNRARSDMYLNDDDNPSSLGLNTIHGLNVVVGTTAITSVFTGWSGFWAFPSGNLAQGQLLPTLRAATQSPAPVVPAGKSLLDKWIESGNMQGEAITFNSQNLISFHGTSNVRGYYRKTIQGKWMLEGEMVTGSEAVNIAYDPVSDGASFQHSGHGSINGIYNLGTLGRFIIAAVPGELGQWARQYSITLDLNIPYSNVEIKITATPVGQGVQTINGTFGYFGCMNNTSNLRFEFGIDSEGGWVYEDNSEVVSLPYPIFEQTTAGATIWYWKGVNPNQASKQGFWNWGDITILEFNPATKHEDPGYIVIHGSATDRDTSNFFMQDYDGPDFEGTVDFNNPDFSSQVIDLTINGRVIGKATVSILGLPGGSANGFIPSVNYRIHFDIDADFRNNIDSFTCTWGTTTHFNLTHGSTADFTGVPNGNITFNTNFTFKP